MKEITAALFDYLDQEAISRAVRSVELPEHEYETASQMIVRGVDGFLADDLTAWEDCLVETTWEETELGVYGTFDLVLLNRTLGTARIIDWKTTTAASFQPNYDDEHLESWQSYMYLGYGAEWLEKAYGLRPEIMQYRAIGPSGVRVITTNARPDFQTNSGQQVFGAESMYRGLQGLYTWPRTLPYPCHKGSKDGPTCPYWHDCTHDSAPIEPIRQATFNAGVPRRRSHVAQFLECPERYRRAVVLGADAKGNSDLHSSFIMNLGSSVTAGLAEVWQQAFRLKNTLPASNKSMPGLV